MNFNIRSFNKKFDDKKKLSKFMQTLNSVLSSNLIKTIAILLAATILCFICNHLANSNDYIATIYILGVVVISRITTGYFWGIFSAVAGVIGTNYYFTAPLWEIDFTKPGYPVIFISMLFVSLITSAMTMQIREQARISTINEQRTNDLYRLNKELIMTIGTENIVNLTLNYLQKFLGGSVAFYLADEKADGGFVIMTKCTNEKHKKIFDDSNERFAASYAMKKRVRTGAKADVCTKAQGTLFPVLAHDYSFGAVSFLYSEKLEFDAMTLSLLDTMIFQVAMALERQKLSDDQQKIVIEAETEKLRGNLLRAISHDLRTPLTSILGSSSTILENKGFVDEETTDKLLIGIKEDAQWLIRMVENLLSVTKISGGTTKFIKSPEVAEEIVAEAVGRMKSRYKGSEIHVTVPEEFLMVPMDATLIEQVLMNLIENAIKHCAKADSDNKIIVDVVVNVEGDNAVFTVSDNGKGINSQDIPYLFREYHHEAKDGEKDEESSSDSTRGMGIGLSICVSIVKAHGGQMEAFNKDSGGAVFRFTLPIENEITEKF